MSYDYSENILVQESAGHLLVDELGWQVELAYNQEVLGENGTFGRSSYKDILLVRYFQKALRTLNPWITDAQVTEAQNTFEKHLSSASLMQINEEKYAYIRDGIPVTEKKPNGQTEEKRAIIIDFQHPNDMERNHFLAVKEMKIHGDLYRRRTDIVGFVNGIPLLFIELKKNSVDVQNAYTDNYTDYLDTIPQLFYYNAFLMLSNGVEAKVATLGSKYEFFHEWKRLSEQEQGSVALETMLRGICKKENFLDLLENFILFDHSGGKTVKILARNHQYLGVNEAVKAYEARKLNNGKLGVFWHTQGSGKSYSMVFLSQKIRRKFAGSPTIVVLTDREELNTQISDTFENCGLLGKTKASKFIATSGEDLINKLKGNPSFIFTLIQKFNKKVDEPIIPDHDIIIMSDEAHRSQYGVFADNMVELLPTASRIGFTGTPLLSNDNITERTFGGYISIYDFKRAVEDKIGIRLDDRYMVAERNPKFRIYRMLIREHLIGRTIEEDERLRKESISKEISIYDLKDFQRLFCTCKFLEKTICDREQWSISTGLDCVFEIIEGNIELYLKVLKEYFDANAPLRLNGYRQIRYLLDSIGYEATYCFIKNNVFDKKNVWMSFIWESVPKENINEKIVNDYKTFVFNNLEKDNPIIPTIQVVARYGERDSEIKEAVIKEVLDNPKLSVKFLGDMYHDDGIEEIINFFKNDISALTSIYMSAIEISCEIDYNGKLFAKIFEQQHTIWNEYVDWVKSKDNMCGDEHKVFELVWRDDKWCEYVEYAFKILIDDNRFFYINEFAGLLFAKTTDATILERKKYYLLEKLRENNSEIEKCKKLIDVVVNILPEWKLEYILEFLKVNKKLEDFKKIDLFPSFCSWSGSEIPLIIEKIDFLKLLKDNLKGIDYIDHRKYIEEYRMDLEKYKEKIELREYIENADYA